MTDTNWITAIAVLVIALDKVYRFVQEHRPNRSDK